MRAMRSPIRRALARSCARMRDVRRSNSSTPSRSKKKASVSTTIASTRLLRSPTVISFSAPAASPSFEGSCSASWVRRCVIPYFWFSSWNCSLLFAQCWKSLT